MPPERMWRNRGKPDNQRFPPAPDALSPVVTWSTWDIAPIAVTVMSILRHHPILVLWLLPGLMTGLWWSMAPSLQGPWSMAIPLGVYGALVAAGLSLWRCGTALPPAMLLQVLPLLAPAGPSDTIGFELLAVALFVTALTPHMASNPATGPRADLTAAAAGLSLALGCTICPSLMAALIAPVLLFSRRQALVYALSALAPLVLLDWQTSPPIPIPPLSGAIAVVTAAAAILLLAGYVRLRRRALVPPIRAARLLTGFLVAQALTVTALPTPAAALMLTAPSLAMLWPLGRPLFPAAIYRRLWTVIGIALAALLLGQLIWQLVLPLPPFGTAPTPNPFAIAK